MVAEYVFQIERSRCSRDKAGNCPYGNEVGTCFGFCWREILHEFDERKRYRDGKEQEEQGNEQH